MDWFSYDVLALVEPPLAVRQELFDFIECELPQREDERYLAIRKLRKALHNQRDQLLAFAGVLDQKLADIAKDFELRQFQIPTYRHDFPALRNEVKGFQI